MSASPLAEISDEDLVAEVHKRIRAGDVDPEDIQIGSDPDENFYEDPILDHHALDEAAVRFARRDYRETLWNLEKALGYAFSGLSGLKPEDLA